MLHYVANTIYTAAQEVADELQHQQQQVASPKQQKQGGEAIFFEERIVLSAFPDEKGLSEPYRADRSLRPFSSVTALRNTLEQKLGNKEYIVWNLAGKSYDYGELQAQILEYDFPARPIPPFSALMELAFAIKTWVESNENNVAIVHDISGRRAAVVVACVLELLNAYSPAEALRVVATQMGVCGNALVASQIRYFGYFCKHHQNPSVDRSERKLVLQRVIVNGVPDFTFDGKLAKAEEDPFCVPFMKIYNQNGVEIDSSERTRHPARRSEESFSLQPTNPLLVVNNDVLIRFFHRNVDSGKESAMFAISFHVGFVTDLVLRFMLSEMDGTTGNPRFLKTMFVDMIFSEYNEIAEINKEMQNISIELTEDGPLDLNQSGEENLLQITEEKQSSSPQAHSQSPPPAPAAATTTTTTTTKATTTTTATSSPVCSSPEILDGQDLVLKEIEDALNGDMNDVSMDVDDDDNVDLDEFGLEDDFDLSDHDE